MALFCVQRFSDSFLKGALGLKKYIVEASNARLLRSVSGMVQPANNNSNHAEWSEPSRICRRATDVI